VTKEISFLIFINHFPQFYYMPEEGEFIGSNYSGPSNFFSKPKYVEILEKIYKGEIKLNQGEYISLPPEDLLPGQPTYFLMGMDKYLDPEKTVIDRLLIPQIIEELQSSIMANPIFAPLFNSIASDLRDYTPLVPFMVDLMWIASEGEPTAFYILKTQNSMFIIHDTIGFFEISLSLILLNLREALQNHFKVNGSLAGINADVGFVFTGVYGDPDLLRDERFLAKVAEKMLYIPYNSERITVDMRILENLGLQRPTTGHYDIEAYYKTVTIKNTKALNVILPKDILNKYIEAFIIDNYKMSTMYLGEE